MCIVIKIYTKVNVKIFILAITILIIREIFLNLFPVCVLKHSLQISTILILEDDNDKRKCYYLNIMDSFGSCYFTVL